MTRTQNRAERALNTTPEDKAAQSDENSMAMELSASEMRGDMVKGLTYLKANLEARQTATSSLPMTDVQALLYVERVASYALHDYPRQFEGDTHITFLWDTFNCIVRMAAAWRTGQNSGDSHMQISIIMKHIDLALEESQRVMHLRSDNQTSL